MTKIIINTDGASRGNPGQAASSFIIKTESGEIIASDGICLGIATNNEAEYSAVKFALEKLITEFSDRLPVQVKVKADSRLIVEQLSGNFKIKNDRMKVLFESVKVLEKKVGDVEYIYIPRAENSKADLLANIALDNN